MILQNDEAVVQKEKTIYYENINDNNTKCKGFLILTNKRIIFEGAEKGSSKFWMLGFNSILNVKGQGRIGLTLFSRGPTLLVINGVNDTGMQRTFYLNVKDPSYWKSLIESYASGIADSGKKAQNSNININLGHAQPPNSTYQSAFSERDTNMIICPKCNAKTSESSKFCNNCGYGIGVSNYSKQETKEQDFTSTLKKKLIDTLEHLASEKAFEDVNVSIEVSLIKVLTSFLTEVKKQDKDVDSLRINSVGLYLNPYFIFKTAYIQDNQKEPFNILVEGKSGQILKQKNVKYGQSSGILSKDLNESSLPKYWTSPEYQKLRQFILSTEQANILSRKVNYYDEDKIITNPEMAKEYLFDKIKNDIANLSLIEPEYSEEVLYKGTKWEIYYSVLGSPNEALYDIEEKRFITLSTNDSRNRYEKICPYCNFQIKDDTKYCPRCAEEIK